MRSIILSTEKNSASFKHYRALSLAFTYEETPQEIQSIFREAFDDPPQDLELFILLLGLSITFYLRSDDINEAQRALELIRQLSKHDIQNDIKVRVLLAEFRIHGVLKNYLEERESISKALRLEKEGTPRWAHFLANRISSAIKSEDFILAQKDLESLRPHAKWAQNAASGSYEYLHALFLYSCGDIDRACALFEKTIPHEEINILQAREKLHIQCLIKLGRFEQAQHRLNHLRTVIARLHDPVPHSEQFIVYMCEYLLAFLALAQKDFSASREHAQKATTGANALNRGRILESRQLIVWIDLASGRSRAARVLLNLLDPDESMSIYAAEWARLYLLEGDRERASGHFKKLMNHDFPNMVEDRLLFAHELSSAQTAGFILNLTREKQPSSISVKKTQSTETNSNLPELVGSSKTIQHLRELIKKCAPLKSTILISGEPGTGKKTVARLLHQLGQNATEPFIPINCGSTSDTLIESELFGHIKGAFPNANRDREGFFVEAGKGTLFLDDIHLLSPHLQSRVLRVLERREAIRIADSKTYPVKARVIATTQMDLEHKFRKDLYFLLMRIHIHIPPLRERVEDIPLLAEHFLKRLYGNFKVALGDDLLEVLQQYSWPGNVRELKTELERIAVAAGDVQVLQASMFRPIQEKKSDIINLSKPVKSPRHKAPLSTDVTEYSHYTLSRQKRLRELFTQMDKVTRADVVRILGCSHPTAGNDLKILENEGIIRRIVTSGNLRTSYFVRSNKISL